MLNKKGQFKDYLLYFFRLLIIIVLLVSVVGLVSIFFSNSLDTDEIELYSIYYRIMHSDYINEVEEGMVKVGRINLVKFNSVVLEEKINYTTPNYIGGRIIIYLEDGNELVLYLNQKLFERIEIVNSGSLLKNSYPSKEWKIPVSYEQNNILKRGRMEIKLVKMK